MKEKEKERRSYDFEFRARQDEENNRYIIEGRPIVYDSMTDLGWFYEVIEKGALDNADISDVFFLVNHDERKIPLARAKEGNENSTMFLTVDDEGMKVTIYLDVEGNTDAKNLYSAIKRGDITGMSFTFLIDTEEWEELDTEKPTRRIKAFAKIYEVSVVTFPAYEEAEIHARDKKHIDEARKQVEEKRKEARKKETKLDYETRALLAMYTGGKKNV